MVIQKTKDYLKCVYANKFTLAGYLSLPISASLAVAGHNLAHDNTSGVFYTLAADVGLIGIACLKITSWGNETLKAYNKSKKYIQKFGKIKSDYQGIKDNWYCSRVGMRLAIEESGLEEVLKK